MKILLDCSPRKIEEYTTRYGHEFGQLRTPLTQNAIAGCDWALDNGCFTAFKKKTWQKMVWEAWEHDAMFVTMPDIVGDARRTIDLFRYWHRFTHGVRRALVLQDGIGQHPIDWFIVDAVFVGGSDAFKISTEAMNACKSAKMLGKWVHVGRVNTPERVRNWVGLADSIDGSGISRYDHMLETVLDEIRGDHPQKDMGI